jgi:tRNA (cytidine/uridine-2'-O-)-methyltransferase
MFHIALVEPEIPPNTGNVARLCAATFARLHIVGAPSFRLDERAVKRAGLDYWNEVDLRRHRRIEDLYDALPDSRFLFIETGGGQIYADFAFRDQDCLIFGRETKGLPADLLAKNRDRVLEIPMPNRNVRSLNLSNSVAIVLYEALRQTRFGK